MTRSGRPWGPLKGDHPEDNAVTAQLRSWIDEAGVPVTEVHRRFEAEHFEDARIPTLAQLREALRGVRLTEEIAQAVVDVCTPDDHATNDKRLRELARIRAEARQETVGAPPGADIARQLRLVREQLTALAGADHPPPAPESHLARVEQALLPSQLANREPELADLTTFATGVGGPSYAWWQAEPWAGKTALLSWFVLRWRPATVDIVAYFIAECLDNNNRESFLRAVIDQLAALAAVEVAPAQARSPELLYSLYPQAARACTRRGRTLLLAVDGLDEDGEAGPGRHSIAGLLPKNVPPGLRVVVTGRPHMPVPDGVPAGHPLRDPGIIRTLTTSPAAIPIREITLRELKRLSADEALGRGLLGFLAVARGGLTTGDLAELLDVPADRIDEQVRGITGRSLAPEQDGVVVATPHNLGNATSWTRRHVLGHDELRRAALQALGVEAAAEEYGGRLRVWADGYRQRGWPADTPHYLLHGYLGLLRYTRDQPALVTLALDPLRQRRLMARAAVDVALAGLDAAVDTVTGDEPADLGVLAAAAASRDLLCAPRPDVAPADARDVARRGDADRARLLASAAPGADGKALALADTACVLADIAHPAAAETALAAARWVHRAADEESPLRAGESGPGVAAAGIAAVRALLDTGQGDAGIGLLCALPLEGSARCRALAEAGGTLSARGDPRGAELLDEASDLADGLEADPGHDPIEPILAWAAVAEAGGRRRAARAQDRIVGYARRAGGGSAAIDLPACAATVLAERRRPEAAELTLLARHRLERAVRASGPSSEAAAGLGTSLHWVVRALVLTTGHADEARRLVASMPEWLRDHFADSDVTIPVPVAPTRPPGGEGTPGGRHGSTTASPEHHRPGHESEPESPTFAGAFPPARRGLTPAMLARLQQPGELSEPALHNVDLAPDSGAVRLPWAAEFAAALVETDAIADAEAFAAAVGHLADRARAYAAASLAATHTGHSTSARRLAEAAARAAERLPDGGGFAHPTTPDGDAVAAHALAAQALAYAGEGARAAESVSRITRPARPDGTASPELRSRRPEARRAHEAVRAGLAHHDPSTVAEFADTELRRLLDRPARLGRLSEVSDTVSRLATLLAVVLPEPRARQQVREALTRTAGAPDGLRQTAMEDVLVQCVSSAADGDRAAALRRLRLRTDLPFRHVHPEQLPLAALAVAFASLGDLPGAYESAHRLSTSTGRAAAFAAVASHLLGVPAYLAPAPLAVDADPMLRVVRILALSAAPSFWPGDTDTQARLFIGAALTGDGWQHALPALALVAPEAVARIRRIVFAHLALDRPGSAG